MTMRAAAAVLGLGVLIAGCEAAEDEDALIGPDRSFGSALGIARAQWDEVSSLADRQGPTPWVALPASGSADYRGVVTGWANGGVPIDYVADLSLEMDFDRRRLSGTVSNMVTDGVQGFAHPDGRIPVRGVLARGEAGAARMVLDGSGVLRGPGMEATYVIDGAGTFAGRRGQAVAGQHATDFVWTQGFLDGTTSRSDGVFSAVAE
jgi:hypothetical protein